MRENIKVLLINPPYSRFKGKDVPVFPLNLGYLAAFLEKHGYVVRIYNADLMKQEETKMFPSPWTGWRTDMEQHSRFVENFPKSFDYIWKEVAQTVADFVPQIVGITAVTANFRPALQIAQICKESIADVLVVMGGPHATVLSESVLTNENVDFLVRGEGELSFLELIRNLFNGENLSQVRGLSYKKQGKVVHNASRPFMDDLDSLPLPSRDSLINSAGYKTSELNRLHKEVLISRGCPYQCNFCASNILWEGYRWRSRSVRNVIEEIKLLINRYGTKEFYLWSDTFTTNQRWTLDFCEEIKPLKVSWSCSTRIDRISKETITAMRAAGCNAVSIGIESGNDRVLKEIGKKITVKEVESAVKVLNKAGMPWTSFFMIGFPTETRSDIEETYGFIKKLRPHSHKIAVAVPYPGTALYEQVKELNLLPEKVDWNWLDGRSRYISFVNNISQNEFIELRDRVFRYADNYNRHKIFKDILQNRLFMFFNNPFGLLRKLFRKAFSLFLSWQ